MSKVATALRVSVPWQVAWFAPAVLVTALYLVLGAEPFSATIGGLAGGVIGSFGAIGFEATKVLQERRRWSRSVAETIALMKDEPPER
jgi:hypothetical protein